MRDLLCILIALVALECLCVVVMIHGEQIREWRRRRVDD